ncbi:uncharacterized protein ACA1_217240 [Acanthamoeba castellanii str. Neff]|uniref:Uncharacterized protein n=1 Tax=Acanthamoeba castellanii (strain ATCC 30010 / Neff) TaxID=1257118 RepID=L8GQK1_ACACF|nr:uncharacterized protein ACA1_217240 [Acanthamoeba castellanii str. Neff]ELR15162.1 hypothetical protein ACA1_217240 [Acanthamoeba castellanii str. Neff]
MEPAAPAEAALPPELPGAVAAEGLPWALGVQANGVVKVHFEREWLSRSPADREVAAAVEHAFRGTCAFDIPPDYQLSIAPVNPFAEAGLRSDSLRQFIQQRGFFMIHVKRGADPLFVSAQDHALIAREDGGVDYRRMEELMQELEEEKRARRKLEWELVEETEARTEQERQLKAERAHNNLLRQRIAELEEQMGAALRGARQAVGALEEGLAISATSLAWSSSSSSSSSTSSGGKGGGHRGGRKGGHK